MKSFVVLLLPPVLFLAGFVFILSVPAVCAQTSPVTISATVVGTTPPLSTNPVVKFTGIAAPNAPITIKRSAQAVKTVTADASAVFEATLVDQPTGQLTYEISAKDESGDTLAPLSFSLDLKSGTTTIISGVFLGPSIAVDKTTAKLGEQVKVFGVTAPRTKVTVTVSSPDTTTYTLDADATGTWSKNVKTTDVGVGNHVAKARAITTDNVVSAFSASVSFAVSALNPAEGKKPSDINLDGQVNLIDFSIMLFYWKQTKPANSRADINGDGRVDIIDFSIMLFDWT